MPNITSEDLEYFQKHTLKPEDTFKFSCKMCGSCCRKREEPIPITGTDIFYIAKELEQHPMEIVQNHTLVNIGPNSKLPILTLKERLDGSCSLMRKSRCTVQKNKPVVCAIFPLGRMLVDNGTAYEYFTPQEWCGNPDTGESHTLKDWLAQFSIEERDQKSMAWQKLFTSAANCIKSMTTCSKENYEKYMVAITIALYINYPLDQPYIESIKKNAKYLEKTLPKYHAPDFD